MTQTRCPDVAAHEAGHAVMAEYLAPGSVARVSLHGEKGPYLGATTFAARRFDSVIVYGLIYAAGAAAECLVGAAPRNARTAPPKTWKADLSLIRLRFLPADIDWLIAAASQILAGPCAVPWARVLAALEVQDLSGAEVRSAFLGPIDLD